MHQELHLKICPQLGLNFLHSISVESPVLESWTSTKSILTFLLGSDLFTLSFHSFTVPIAP